MTARNRGGYTTDTNNPPLYYFAAAGVYHLSPWTSLPDRVHFLRLFSALLTACTVLLIFLFLRELLPGTPWAWAVGALAVAFQPMFAFTSSGVTSDTILYLASAGIFYTLARAFRRGLTLGGGLAIGAFAALGILSKMNMIGLAPGILVGDRRAGGPGGEAAPRRGSRRGAGGVRGGPRSARGLHAAQLDRLGPRPLLRPCGVQGPTGIAVPGRDGDGLSHPRRRLQLHVAVLPPAAPLDALDLRRSIRCGRSGSTASSASSAGSTPSSRTGSTTSPSSIAVGILGPRGPGAVQDADRDPMRGSES